jgi:hypothetical protein
MFSILICLLNYIFAATSQLSKIKSTPAKVDSEFDMLAQSRSSDTKTKELDVDLLQGQTKPTDFDEIEEWLKAEKSANDGEESLTSKEFDKFLAERAAVAEALPNVTARNEDSRSKKKQEESLLG